MIFVRIIRNLSCKASAFLLRRLWPFWAPFSLAFINVWALVTQKLPSRNTVTKQNYSREQMYKTHKP